MPNYQIGTNHLDAGTVRHVYGKLDDWFSRMLICPAVVGCDAVSLFPNLRAEETAKVVANEFLRSSMKVEDVSWKDAACHKL